MSNSTYTTILISPTISFGVCLCKGIRRFSALVAMHLKVSQGYISLDSTFQQLICFEHS